MSPRDCSEDVCLRNYQINLMDIAYKRNTIVYLPTGTGKTLIAVMLIKKLGPALQKPLSQGGKISIMLANTTALVDQHSEYLKRFISFDVGTYSGSVCNKTWSKIKWKERLDAFQVFVMTPRVLCNILKDSILSFSDINLLILDECHRAVHNHPMSEVMENYSNFHKDVPRVLGLTATLLNKNCNPTNSITEIKMLEKKLHSEIVTVEPQHTKMYSTNPTEIIKIYCEEDLTGMVSQAVHELQNLLTAFNNAKLNSLNTISMKVLRDLKSVIQDTIIQIQTFGIYGGKVAIKLRMEQLLDYKRATNLDMKVLMLTNATITLFCWIRKTYKNEINHNHKKDCLHEHFSDRLLILLDILKQHKKLEKSNFCAIVFIKRRLTAKILYHILMKLKLLSAEYSSFCPNFVLGCNSSSTSKSSLLGLYKAKVYKGIIEQFCKRQINLLVASNVLEEGIDIPTCTLIINFDEPKDYRGYVQSKGRARSKNSNYYVMISKSRHATFMKSYKSYKETQEVLQEYFTKERMSCDTPEFGIENLAYEKSTNSTKLSSDSGHTSSSLVSCPPTMDSAVNFINRYCASLPHDKYTIYLPKWSIQQHQATNNNLFKATLKLPMICQYLGSIEGPFMQSKELAVNATAYKACNMLKEKGELDDNWLPKLHTEIDDDNLHYFQHWTKHRNVDVTVKTHVYEKTAPKILRQQIESCKPSFVHVIQLKPQFHQSNKELNQFQIYEHYSSSTTFGFVTAERLPELCDFSIYVPEGVILVTIKVNKVAVTLTSNQIHDLRLFHYYVFKDVMGILEDFLIFNNELHAEMLLMMPVYKKSNIYGIHFDILQMTQTKVLAKMNNKEYTNAICTKPITLGNVVTTHSSKENYLICSVADNTEIQGRLLTKLINYFKPTSPKVTLKCLKSDSCFVQDFPADLWIQASLLPSIVYRIITILQAHELRQTIATGTGLGAGMQHMQWLPLTIEENIPQTKYYPALMDDSIISMNFGLRNICKNLKNDNTSLLNSDNVSNYNTLILPQIILREDLTTKNEKPISTVAPGGYGEVDLGLIKCRQQYCGPELTSIVKALTGMKCNDIINYERAETLGDSFLKFTVSLFIILKYPDYNEGKATVLKSSIISNKNLFYAGLDNELFKYVRNTSFTAWKPPSFIVPKELKTKLELKEISMDSVLRYTFDIEEIISGVLWKELQYHDSIKRKERNDNCFLNNERLTNKTIADSVESLLGIYFESCGLQGGLHMLTWLRIMPPSQNIETLFNMVVKNPLLKCDATNDEVCLHIPSWNKIEEVLGYKFNNHAYLLQALTHSSYNSNCLTDCYQRFEFLGDAILDFVITCHIYETYEDLNPGELTDLRSALVNNATFAGFTVRSGFYNYLLLSNGNLLQSIDKFVKFQKSRNFEINDNVLILSEEKNLYIAEHVEVPKVLGDLFESIAAAIFLDCGMDLQIVWKVVYRIICTEIKNFAKDVPKNPVRLLYEATEAKPYFHERKSMDTGETMIAVEITLSTGEIQTVYGFGENKYCAKKAAATLALRLLHNE